MENSLIIIEVKKLTPFGTNLSDIVDGYQDLDPILQSGRTEMLGHERRMTNTTGIKDLQGALTTEGWLKDVGTGGGHEWTVLGVGT